MFRFNRWIGVLGILLCTSVALAQRPPGGSGFGGGPPRGGFGFGVPGSPPSLLMLAAAESVQKELSLKEDQVAKIKTLGEEAGKEMRSAFSTGGFGDGAKQSDEEREKRREEARTKMSAAVKKVNDQILPKLHETLDATQRERLQQIRLQAWGCQALLDADIAKSLNLDKEQSSKLTAISKEFSEKQSALFQRGDGDNNRGDIQERFAKMRELNESRDKQLAEVLTTDQRAEWEKMKGKSFDVAQLRGGFGTRGAPGGGAAPGGRPQRRSSTTDPKKADDNK